MNSLFRSTKDLSWCLRHTHTGQDIIPAAQQVTTKRFSLQRQTVKWAVLNFSITLWAVGCGLWINLQIHVILLQALKTFGAVLDWDAWLQMEDKDIDESSVSKLRVVISLAAENRPECLHFFICKVQRHLNHTGMGREGAKEGNTPGAQPWQAEECKRRGTSSKTSPDTLRKLYLQIFSLN